MPLHDGDTILDGKYRIVRLIGEGGSARVWLAEEPEFGNRQVAIKELRRDELSQSDLEEMERYFRQEVEIAALLFKHRVPNVIRAITLERLPDGNRVLVMEYAGGGSLADRIAGNPKGLPLDEAVQITLAICQALQPFHNLPLAPVHRDIKPSNILFDAEGHAYLSDFGLAQLPGRSDRSVRVASPHPGTVLYSSPEQIQSPLPLNPSADIFSLGCVLFEMLTGQRYRRVKPGSRASSLRPDVPLWLDEVASKAVAEDQWQRYQKAEEMAAGLQAARAEAEEKARAEAQVLAAEQARREARARAHAEASARRVAQEAAHQQTPEEARGKAEEQARQHTAEQVPATPAPPQTVQFTRAQVAGLVAALAVVMLIIARVLGTMTAAPAPTPTAQPTASLPMTAAPASLTATPVPPSPTSVLPTATSLASSKQPAPRKTYTASPAMTIDSSRAYTATIVTNKGVFVLRLLPAVAPKTVNSFVFLAREGFYDGLTFHRVEDWIVQGGDPTGMGNGGPGYTLPSEFNATKHITGTLGMAASSDPNSAGSQFYIVKTEASWLDNHWTVFGQAVQGMDVVNKLVKGDVMQKVVIEEAQ